MPYADAMGQNSPLFDARLKLERALERIEAARTLISAYMQSKSIRFEGLIDAEREIVSRIIRFDRRPAPVLSAILGEAIYNLRCALDYAVFRLVLQSTGVESTNNKGQFPIFKNETGFNSRGVRQNLVGVSAEATALIKTFQPFSTGEGTDSPLWHLRELSNWDKHRALHLTCSTTHHLKIGHNFGGFVMGMAFPATGLPLEDGTTILSMQIMSGPGTLEERAEIATRQAIGRIAVQISFAKPSIDLRKDVHLILGTIHQRVVNIIDRIDSEIILRST